MKPRRATAQDLTPVEALLVEAGLPLDGVAEHLAAFLVVKDASGVVGAAGIEIHEPYALLRSVCVAPSARGVGLGRALVDAQIAAAAAAGVHAVFLLTTSAGDYFARTGFRLIARDEVPAEVHRSRELQGACPSSAIVMRLDLRPLAPSSVLVGGGTDEDA